MINLARWLRAITGRKPARRSSGHADLPNRRAPEPPTEGGMSSEIGLLHGLRPVRRFYEDKAMRPRGDYQDKEIA